jgi:prepilin-type N-terminal cleavage/methylation domain-containing protein
VKRRFKWRGKHWVEIAAIGRPSYQRASPLHAAFSLIEVTFAVAIVGVLVITLYGALASSVTLVRACQENERVTQILSDKMDTVRLYNWTQMTNGFVLTNFVLGIDPLDSASRPYYTGTIAIAQAPIPEAYKTNLLQVTVTVDWVSDSRPQTRSMSTYVAKYGLQTYIMR